MPESLVITCPEHAQALIPQPDDPQSMYCPDAGCTTLVRLELGERAFPFSPMTALQQNAAEQHELVVSREQAGFSRSEAMQILCTFIYAGIMKGSGSG